MRRIIFSFFIAILLLNGPAVYGATTAELQAQIAALLQQVQALQAQLQGGSASVILTFNLRLGSTDAATNGEVTKLQQFLARDKVIYPEGLVTGYFGFKTEAAVKRFQTQNNISAIGVVGPQTREAIKKASTPPAVTSTTVTVTPTPTLVSTPTPAPPPAVNNLGKIILSPSSGQVTETLTITGSGFAATGNEVYFGAGSMKNLTSFNGSTMITFTIPGEAGSTKILPGSYELYVSNVNGKTATSTFVVGSGVSYPSIVSVSPSTAKIGDSITVTGTGFTVPGNDVHIGVGGLREITTLAKVKGTQLIFSVPATINSCDHSTGLPPCNGKSYSVVPGNYALYIVNANGKTNSVTFTVTSY